MISLISAVLLQVASATVEPALPSTCTEIQQAVPKPGWIHNSSVNTELFDHPDRRLDQTLTVLTSDQKARRAFLSSIAVRADAQSLGTLLVGFSKIVLEVERCREDQTEDLTKAYSQTMFVTRVVIAELNGANGSSSSVDLMVDVAKELERIPGPAGRDIAKAFITRGQGFSTLLIASEKFCGRGRAAIKRIYATANASVGADFGIECNRPAPDTSRKTAFTPDSLSAEKRTTSGSHPVLSSRDEDCPSRPASADVVRTRVATLERTGGGKSPNALLAAFDELDQASCAFRDADLATRGGFVVKRRSILLSRADRAKQAGDATGAARLILAALERERPWLPGADNLAVYQDQTGSGPDSCESSLWARCALPQNWPDFLSDVYAGFDYGRHDDSSGDPHQSWWPAALSFAYARNLARRSEYGDAAKEMSSLVSVEPLAAFPWIGPVPSRGVARQLAAERAKAVGGIIADLHQAADRSGALVAQLDSVLASGDMNALHVFLVSARDRPIGADADSPNRGLSTLLNIFAKRIGSHGKFARLSAQIADAAVVDLLPFVRSDRELKALYEFASATSLARQKSSAREAKIWETYSSNTGAEPKGLAPLELGSWYLNRSDWANNQDGSVGLTDVSVADALRAIELFDHATVTESQKAQAAKWRLDALHNIASGAPAGSDARLKALLALPPEDREEKYYRERDLAETYLAQGELAEAERFARFHLGHPQTFPWDQRIALVILADILLREGKAEEAGKLVLELDRAPATDNAIPFSVDAQERRLRNRLSILQGKPAAALERALGAVDGAISGAEMGLSGPPTGAVNDADLKREEDRRAALAARPIEVRRRWTIGKDYVGPRGDEITWASGDFTWISNDVLHDLLEASAAQPVQDGRRSGDNVAFLGGQRLIRTRTSADFYRATLRRRLANIQISQGRDCGRPVLAATLRRSDDAEDLAATAADASAAGLTGIFTARADVYDKLVKALSAARAADAADAASGVVRKSVARCIPSFDEIVDPRPIDIDEVQRRLGPREGLLVLVPGDRELFAFAITRAKVTEFNAGSKNRIARLMAALRCRLDERNCSAVMETSEGLPGDDDKDPSELLSAALFAPASEVLADATTLYTVSGAEFAEMPFAALKSGTGGSDWLSDRFAFVTLPGVANLKPFAPASAITARATSFFGAGNPVPPAGAVNPVGVGHGQVTRAVWISVAGAQRRVGFAPLPGTAIELAAMARVLSAPASAILMGPAATKGAVMQSLLLRTADVVAFATHGFLAGDAGMKEPGLVFSLPMIPSKDDNGYLSASEAAGLRLRARWVILSACNTSGSSKAGESLSGLARSFLFAGAQALLVSHWRIVDRAAALLTVETLNAQRIDPSLTKAVALQRAMHAVRTGRRSDASAIEGWTDDLSDPAAWAPFTIIADRDER